MASKESSFVKGVDQSLVVSVELLRRSVSIRLDGYDIVGVSRRKFGLE